MPTKKKTAPTPPVDENPEDLSAKILEMVRVLDQAVAPAGIAELSGLDLARATEILDDLVGEGLLALDDNQCYRLTPCIIRETDEYIDVALGKSSVELDPDVKMVSAAEEVTIEGEYDDRPLFVELDPDSSEVNSVSLPTSDLLRFLTNINLPPQLIAGLGALSDLSGVLSYEVAEATPEDPHPMRRFNVRIEGHHTCHLAALNPNQPGYVENPSLLGGV